MKYIARQAFKLEEVDFVAGDEVGCRRELRLNDPWFVLTRNRCDTPATRQIRAYWDEIDELHRLGIVSCECHRCYEH